MVNLINRQKNIFNDNIAFVEQWDFSQANLSEANRINAITQVASICYQNPKALNSDSLYNRLMAESIGLPSSSFEFVPMLFDYDALKQYIWEESDVTIEDTNMLKYGEKVEDGKYLLTNFRAVIYDKEKFDIDLTKKFNTEEECAIIKKHFKVFLFKVDFPTRSQMVRHRVNWQELSRRYVSGERVPFEFYISNKMKDVKSCLNDAAEYDEFSTQMLINACIKHYQVALEKGVKPQEARRIIPQAAYTQIWGAFQPSQLENYFKLRLDSHAQWEIRQTAKAMKSCILIENYLSNMTPEREADIQSRLESIEAGTAEFLTTEELELLLSDKTMKTAEN